jgi:hypothetical protein
MPISAKHDPYSGERFEHIRRDISRRLRLICRHLEVADFAVLIEKMAREQVRDEQIDHSLSEELYQLRLEILRRVGPLCCELTNEEFRTVFRHACLTEFCDSKIVSEKATRMRHFKHHFA